MRSKLKSFYSLIGLLVVLRFILAIISPVTGDALWHLSVSKFIATHGYIPSTEVYEIGGFFWAPPIFNILAALSYFFGSFFGLEKIFIKLASPLLGSLSILLTYRIAKELTDNEEISILSALIFAILPISMYMSIVSFTDIGACFFILLSIYVFLVALKKNNNYWWVLNFFALGLALLSKYTAVSLIPTYFVFFIYLKSKKLSLVKFGKIALSIFGGILLSLPWYSRNYLITGKAFYNPAVLSIMNISGFNIQNFLLTLSDFWIGIPSSPQHIPYYFEIVSGYTVPINLVAFLLVAFTTIFTILVLHGIKRSQKFMPERNKYFLLMVLLFFSLAFLNIAFHFPLSARYILPAVPVLAIFLAIGLYSLKNKIALKTVYVGLLVLTFMFAIQITVAVILTESRVSGWSPCLTLLKENIKNERIFYFFNPAFIIYNTDIQAVTFNEEPFVHGTPSNSSLLFDLRINEFVDNLKQHNISYIYIDTIPEGDVQLYLNKLERALSQNIRAQEIFICENKVTGGRGILYRI